MRQDRQVIELARSVLASRTAARPSDTGYLIYVAVLVVALVAVPAAVTIVRGLAEPEVVNALFSPDSYRVVGMITAILAAGALLLGRTRGAVVPTPFLTEFLAGSGLPRSDTLRRSFLTSATVLGCCVLTTAGLVIGALCLGGEARPVSAALFVLGCLGLSGVLAVLWLMGQSLSRRITVGLAVGIGASSLATNIGGVLHFAPWGWTALLWRSLSPGTPTLWWPVIALAVSSLALLAVPALLNNLRSDEIMAQSRRWQSVGSLVQTGDVAGASGILRDPPVRGRRLRMPLTGPLIWVIVQRDFTAARRFPVRIVLGSSAIVGAGWLTAPTSTVPDGVGWITALTGALLAYLGVGVWCDGLRNASENAGPGSMYGRTALTMIGSHAVLPASAAVVFGAAGSIGSGAPVVSMAWWTLLSVFIVLVRVLDSAKGPMPIGLLLPIPTPLGDVSILNTLAWQADAVLIVLIVAGGLTRYAGTAGLAAALWIALAALLVAALALRRVRALGG